MQYSARQFGGYSILKTFFFTIFDPIQTDFGSADNFFTGSFWNE